MPRAWTKPYAYTVEHGVELVNALSRAFGGSRTETVRREALPGRIEPCSCGSGKEFKKCCGKGGSPSA